MSYGRMLKAPNLKFPVLHIWIVIRKFWSYDDNIGPKFKKPSFVTHIDGYLSPKSEPILELHSRAALSVEAHHHVNGPDTGKNSGGRWIIKKLYWYRHKVCPEIGNIINFNSSLLSPLIGPIWEEGDT